MRVLLFDDEEDLLRAWAGELEALGLETEVLSVDDFQEAMSQVEERRKASRSFKPWDKSSTPFDETDVFVVDYDLLNLEQGPSTGAEVAYLVRCFTSCALVVGLNQYHKTDFDLSLGRHVESFADLDVRAGRIASAGLWQSTGWEEFRPWYWPTLPNEVQSIRACSESVIDLLDVPVLDFFGLQEFLTLLPQASLDLLAVSDRSTEEVTIREAVRFSEVGVRGKDSGGTFEDADIGRIAAARLRKWLDTTVLHCQSVIVDAPHLALRFPSLLEGPIDEVASWNSTATTALEGSVGLDETHLVPAQFARPDWLTRRAWFWPIASSLEAIPEVSKPFGDYPEPGFVFCEDTSRFAPNEEADEFSPALETPFLERYVRKNRGDDALYAPMDRLFAT